MIRLNEIKAALTRLLDQYFPEMHIFTEDVEQLETEGEPVFPALHLQLVPAGNELAMGADTKDKVVLVDITFMEESKSRNSTMYEIRDRMEEAVGTGIQVRDRYLHVESIGSTVADDLLHVTFNLKYNDSFPRTVEEYELFEQLDMDIRKDG